MQVVFFANFPVQRIMEWLLHTCDYLCVHYARTSGIRIILWPSMTQHILNMKQEHKSPSALVWVFCTLLRVHCVWLCKLFWTTWTWICATVSQKNEARILEVWEACLYFHLHILLVECHVTCDAQAFIHYHQWYMECSTRILSYLWSSWYGLTIFLGAGCNMYNRQHQY